MIEDKELIGKIEDRDYEAFVGKHLRVEDHLLVVVGCDPEVGVSIATATNKQLVLCMNRPNLKRKDGPFKIESYINAFNYLITLLEKGKTTFDEIDEVQCRYMENSTLDSASHTMLTLFGRSLDVSAEDVCAFR